MLPAGSTEKQRCVFQNNSCHEHWRTQTAHQAERVTQFNAKESVMNFKEEAELLFKHGRLSGGGSSIPEYEERARVERTKTASLRALRLARKAELAPCSENAKRAE